MRWFTLAVVLSASAFALSRRGDGQPPAAPQISTFHVGVEAWVLKEPLGWNLTVPPGARIRRVYGELSAGPQGGWRDNGVVRQALFFAHPLGESVEVGPLIGFTSKPPETKAFSNVDRHLFVVILKVAGGGTAHYHVDVDYRSTPRAIPGGVIRLNLIPTAQMSDPARTRWFESNDPMEAVDAECQLYFEIEK